MAFLTRLQLAQFRCYEEAGFDNLVTGPVVLYGPNGAGKTNILEAVSLLSPGRGLRNAKAGEIQKHGIDISWAVAAEAETAYGPVRLGTGLDPSRDKRIVRINGEAAKSQNALAEYLACVWLTPQMDRLFVDTASSRRRFLDRLVFAFDAGHSGRTTRFDNAMSQRSKILREYMHPDPAWLDALESTMAETGVAIAAGRLECMEKLQHACDSVSRGEDDLFPRARLSMRGTLEELLARAPALEVEDLYKYQLRQSRAGDMVTGGAATGPHKSDLFVAYTAKSMPAAQCSTGEQKALLIGIILAHSRLVAAEKGAPPILLLDEVAAHLDDNRRTGLYELLMTLGGQVWMTGTDRMLFDALGSDKAAFFRVEASRIQEESHIRAA